MRNILLLSFDGTSQIIYDERPEYETIVNTWKKNVTEYPHPCKGVFYSPTQRHGEAMYIQSKILRDLKSDYDYVASFCHDLKIKVSEINRYFRIAHQNNLDCFGPSMTKSSYISHKQFTHQGTNEVIPQDWIEIMAIGFSRRCYEKLIDHLDLLYGKINLVGGWGLDNKLIKYIISQNQYKCGMIDEIQVNHFVKVTRGEIKWRNKMSSRDCMAFFDMYVRSLEHGGDRPTIEKRSRFQGTLPHYEPADKPTINKFENILYVRLTCLAEKNEWNSYRKPNINQVLLCGDPNLKTNYELRDDVLYLKCQDTYEFLPTKMVMAFNAILSDDKFKDVTHILKLDNDINIDVVWNFVNRRSQFIEDVDYSGGKVMKCKNEPGSDWHFGRVPITSIWHNKKFFEKYIDFCSGGHTYTLSRKSLRIICNEFNFKNIDVVHQKYILEDLMVGLILERNDIRPKDLGLKLVNTSSSRRYASPKKYRPYITNPPDKTTEVKERNLVVQIFFDHKLISNKQKTHTNHNRGPIITSRMRDYSLFYESQRRAKDYAKKCGAEYVLFDKPVTDFFSASMERMRLIEEEKWARDYDNILYLDCDALISDHCPDLFKLYPQKNLRVCHTLMTNKWLLDKESVMAEKFGEEALTNGYFNGGVLLFHSSSLKAMKGKLKYRERFNTYAFDDQSELNWVVMDNDIPVTFMERRFNAKPGTNVMITHYLGNLKHRFKPKPAKAEKITSVTSKIHNPDPNTLVVRLKNSRYSPKGMSDDSKEITIFKSDTSGRFYDEVAGGLILNSPTNMSTCAIKAIMDTTKYRNYKTYLITFDDYVLDFDSSSLDARSLQVRKIHPGSYLLTNRSMRFLSSIAINKDALKDEYLKKSPLKFINQK